MGERDRRRGASEGIAGVAAEERAGRDLKNRHVKLAVHWGGRFETSTELENHFFVARTTERAFIMIVIFWDKGKERIRLLC
jgi:hypothetical protein